jgi:hypothetical protein
MRHQAPSPAGHEDAFAASAATSWDRYSPPIDGQHGRDPGVDQVIEQRWLRWLTGVPEVARLFGAHPSR